MLLLPLTQIEKMKKISLSFVLLFLLNAVSFAQTKEETISWLKEKFEKCGNMDFGPNNILIDLKYEITECKVLITVRSKGTYSNELETWIYTLPTRGVKIWGTGKTDTDFEKKYSGNIGYESAVIQLQRFNSKSIETSSESQYYTGLISGGPGGTNWSLIYFSLRKKEDAIYERIQKALDHLATFCPKKKEAF